MWVSFILIGIVSVVAVAYVIWPLFGSPPVSVAREREELAELLTFKDATLQAINELAFDHSVGKMEDDDFERFDRILRNRAKAILLRLDQFSAPPAHLDASLLEEVAALRRVEGELSHEGGSRNQEE